MIRSVKLVISCIVSVVDYKSTKNICLKHIWYYNLVLRGGGGGGLPSKLRPMEEI